MEIVISILKNQIKISEERLKTAHYPIEVEPSVKNKIKQCKEAITALSEPTTSKETTRKKHTSTVFALLPHLKIRILHKMALELGLTDYFHDTKPVLIIRLETFGTTRIKKLYEDRKDEFDRMGLCVELKDIL